MAYQGWANRDTWLVGLWINNDRGNYEFVRRNKKALLKMKRTRLLTTLKRNCKFGDKVDWSNVRVTEIKRDVISPL